jgi:hypothetical protein
MRPSLIKEDSLSSMASVAVVVSVECQDYFLPSTGVFNREKLSIGTPLGVKVLSLR